MLNALVPSWVGYDHEPQRRTIVAGTSLFHATLSRTARPLDPTELHEPSYFSIDPRHPIHVLVEHNDDGDGDGDDDDDKPGYFHPMLFEFLVIRDIPGRFQQEGDDPAAEFLLRFPARRTDYLRHVRTFHFDAEYFERLQEMGNAFLALNYASPGFDDKPGDADSVVVVMADANPWPRMSALGVCDDALRAPGVDDSLSRRLAECRVTVANVLSHSTLTSYLLMRQLQERFGATRPLALSIAALLAAAAFVNTRGQYGLGEMTQIYTFSSTEHVHTFTEDVTYVDPAHHAPISEAPEVRLLAHLRLATDQPASWSFAHRKVEAAIVGIAVADEYDTDPDLGGLAIEFCIRVLLYVRYHRRARFGVEERLRGRPYAMSLPMNVRAFESYPRLRQAAATHDVRLIWDDSSDTPRPAPDGESPLKRTRLERRQQRATDSLLY